MSAKRFRDPNCVDRNSEALLMKLDWSTGLLLPGTVSAGMSYTIRGPACAQHRRWEIHQVESMVMYWLLINTKRLVFHRLWTRCWPVPKNYSIFQRDPNSCWWMGIHWVSEQYTWGSGSSWYFLTFVESSDFFFLLVLIDLCHRYQAHGGRLLFRCNGLGRLQPDQEVSQGSSQ